MATKTDKPIPTELKPISSALGELFGVKKTTAKKKTAKKTTTATGYLLPGRLESLELFLLNGSLYPVLHDSQDNKVVLASDGKTAAGPLTQLALETMVLKLIVQVDKGDLLKKATARVTDAVLEDGIEVASWDRASEKVHVFLEGLDDVAGTGDAVEPTPEPEPDNGIGEDEPEAAPEPEAGDAVSAILAAAPTDEQLAPEKKVKKARTATAPEPDPELDEAMEGMSKSDKIRYLIDRGYPLAFISKYLGVHYSFAFNVRKAHVQGKKWVNPNKNAQPRKKTARIVLDQDQAERLRNFLAVAVETIGSLTEGEYGVLYKVEGSIGAFLDSVRR